MKRKISQRLREKREVFWIVFRVGAALLFFTALFFINTINERDIRFEEPEQEPFTSSFTDLFSSDAWIDTEKTSMERNNLTTAFTFPPLFEWRAGVGEDIGSRASDLSEAGLPTGVPETVRGRDIVSESYDTLESVTVVGYVTREDDRYRGWVFWYDGNEFRLVLGGDDNRFISPYEGVFGFGGTDRDWLAIYGAYESIAYRVKAKNLNINISTSDVNIIDVSRFLPIRVMNGGFEPEIIRVELPGTGDGKIGDERGAENPEPIWYIGSKTNGKPKLVKLFQNGTEEIQGAFDFSELLFSKESGIASARIVHSYVENNMPILRFVINDDSSNKRLFYDKGFDHTVSREIVSQNLNTYSAKVLKSVIVDAQLSRFAENAFQFFLANKKDIWIPAYISRGITFPEAGDFLRWRAHFAPQENPFFSPYFDSIRIDFEVGEDW